MRKLASIQKIVSLSPIEKADKIELATVLGWQVVVEKNKYSIGDLCVYCEIDSILPDKHEFEFLRERKFRIRTIKLKGQVSQGICFPLSILPKKKYTEGDDVTDILGVKKYDPQAVLEQKEIDRLSNIKKNRLNKFFMRYHWYKRIVFKPSKRPFPGWIKKTDEDRIQLFPNICNDCKDVPFVVTEKLDGQSATFFVIKNRSWTKIFQPYLFGVCSRNFQLLRPDGQSYWEVAKRLKIKDVLIKFATKNKCLWVVVQGEIIGPKIQGNKYKRTENEFYVFNEIFSNGAYTSVYINTKNRDGLSWKYVPIIDFEFSLPPYIHDMVEYSKGKSVIADVPREGLVVRNYDKDISFKVINPDFLLKYDE